MAEPEDLLSESLQVLYDCAPVAHSSAGSVFTYTYPGLYTEKMTRSTSNPLLTITVRTPDTQAANWPLHASSIWMSSLYMADNLSELDLDRHIRVVVDRGERLRVLELGAGAGLPGILNARLYDDVEVVSSDYPDEELIRTLSDNIKQNEGPDRCRAVPYAWGSDPAILFTPSPKGASPLDPSFDVVIAADTLWNSELHSLFIQTICSTLKRSTESRVYLVAGLHTGRYTIQAFLRAVSETGLEIETATEKEINGTTTRPWNVERDEETEKDRRRWVVWVVLRWGSL
ncbi:uncharacterized protein LAESUDRAFT_812283 [Laetiporus sulphureus 93-53]|uniref:Nicotinamide N-methyltransferase n=1 Tax=Laetiporus sulphureus 93-53 TaxID=1314785 RepID=A0A165ELB4_9APHY|nr:uncharacterized protein LAESUDRAFT_812283 [Laetiporus sulphureus 93-53]KZT07296.1 hypothetical protein LAESUDRAFT_812283 [Laetiporus sulphureus 93-53]